MTVHVCKAQKWGKEKQKENQAKPPSKGFNNKEENDEAESIHMGIVR